MNDYDCTKDVKDHKEAVKRFMGFAIKRLSERAHAHDDSKLESPEKEMFDQFTPLLKSLEYGSDEYKKALGEMGMALKHHYDNNSHHPEHYENGIDGMSLLDLIEMLCDWQASWTSTVKGTSEETLEYDKMRFGMSDQLFEIIPNTLIELL